MHLQGVEAVEAPTEVVVVAASTEAAGVKEAVSTVAQALADTAWAVVATPLLLLLLAASRRQPAM